MGYMGIIMHRSRWEQGDGTHGQWGTYLTSFWQLDIFKHYLNLNHPRLSQGYFWSILCFFGISIENQMYSFVTCDQNIMWYSKKLPHSFQLFVTSSTSAAHLNSCIHWRPWTHENIERAFSEHWSVYIDWKWSCEKGDILSIKLEIVIWKMLSKMPGWIHWKD